MDSVEAHVQGLTLKINDKNYLYGSSILFHENI
jgi:hypothetical protein